MSQKVYLDSSVLVRFLFNEPGERISLKENDEIYSSELIEIEVFRTLESAYLIKRISEGEYSQKCIEATEFISGISVIPLNREVLKKAASSFPFVIRTLDAIHVATAQWLKDELSENIIFCTHDERQGNAAISRRLLVKGIR